MLRTLPPSETSALEAFSDVAPLVAPLVALSFVVSSDDPPQPVNIVAAIAVHRSTLNTFFLIKSLL